MVVILSNKVFAVAHYDNFSRTYLTKNTAYSNLMHLGIQVNQGPTKADIVFFTNILKLAVIVSFHKFRYI